MLGQSKVSDLHPVFLDALQILNCDFNTTDRITWLYGYGMAGLVAFWRIRRTREEHLGVNNWPHWSIRLAAVS